MVGAGGGHARKQAHGGDETIFNPENKTAKVIRRKDFQVLISLTQVKKKAPSTPRDETVLSGGERSQVLQEILRKE